MDYTLLGINQQSFGDMNKIKGITNSKLSFIFQISLVNWTVTQTIKLTDFAVRIQFISNDQLAVQLSTKNKLLIYNYSKYDNQFKQGQIIEVKYGESDFNLFPMQYIQSKGILINKNCQYINVIQRKLNRQFTLSQTIDFGCQSLYGCASEDGELLFTWDKGSKEIQIRKLVEIE